MSFIIYHERLSLLIEINPGFDLLRVSDRKRERIPFAHAVRNSLHGERHVARLEAMVALGELLRRIPDLALPEGAAPTYSNSTITRNMDSLPLVFTPAPRESTVGTVGVHDR